jgi:RNA polymerase sigma factor (TIGR02999 family)
VSARFYTWRVAEAQDDVTELLLRWSAGDAQALDALTPLLYKDLRRLAGDLLRRERPGHTLSATALVHEIYMRLVDQRRVRWENRAHFFGAAAHIMRRVLVDHARARTAVKRGGLVVKTAIEEDSAVVGGLAEEIIDLDTALGGLAALDERKARVVEMKYFAGMTNQEIATALGISDATVERDWKVARAWLIKALGGPSAATAPESTR